MRLVMENPTKSLLIALLFCGTCSLALAGSNTGSLSITATVTTDFLNYGITQPATTSPWTSCAGSTVWGSTVGGSVYTPSGVTWSAAAAQAFTVCGSVPAAQNISAQSYSDTVTVTVNF